MAISNVGGFKFCSFYACHAFDEDDQIEAIKALTNILDGVPEYANELVSGPVIPCMFTSMVSLNQELAHVSVHCLLELQSQLTCSKDLLICYKFPCHTFQYLYNLVSVEGPVTDERIVKMVFELLIVRWKDARTETSAMLAGSEADIGRLLERCLEKIPFQSVKEVILFFKGQFS